MVKDYCPKIFYTIMSCISVVVDNFVKFFFMFPVEKNRMFGRRRKDIFTLTNQNWVNIKNTNFNKCKTKL